MKGIFLTEEGKKNIEIELIFLEDERKQSSSDNNDYYQGRIRQLEMILKSAIILPIEDSWENVEHIFDYDIKKRLS